MTDNIGPLARLFRGMADRVDHDRTSQTRYEAIVKAAGVAAARAAAEGTVTGPLWDADGTDLLAPAYAFHVGLSRQAAVADQVRGMEETPVAGAGEQRQPPASPSQRVGRTAATPPAGSRRPLPRRDQGRRPWTRIACRGPASVTWTRPRRSGCGRCWRNCAAARSPRAGS